MILDIDNKSLAGFSLADEDPEEFEGNSRKNLGDGYSINVYQNLISSLFVCFKRGYFDYEPFDGYVRFLNKNYQFSSNTSTSDIQNIFGEPNNSWNDGVECCMEYTFGDFTLEVIWDVTEESALKYIALEM